MMRLFVAVLLPEEVRESVQRMQTYLRAVIGEESIRWTQPEQFHFTLKFLGDVAESDLPLIREGIERAAARSTVGSLDVGGIGVFPRQRSPQVLWVGATGDVPVLTRCAQSLNEALEEQGFPAETKPYIPHITLARMKTREGEEAVARVLPTLQSETMYNATLGTFLMQACVLMQSDLRPQGAVYTPLETFAFGTHNEYNR